MIKYYKNYFYCIYIILYMEVNKDISLLSNVEKQYRRKKVINETKICNTCYIEKDIIEFNKRSGFCKDCYKIKYNNKYRSDKYRNSKSGYIYIIINPAWKEYIKIGRSVNVELRLEQYQTNSPLRDYQIYYKTYTNDLYKVEDYFNKHIKGSYEWFEINKDEAIKLIETLIC